MPASLSFKKDDKTTDATDLKDVRIITLEDSGGSKYTLDITGNDLKVECTPGESGDKVEKTITGLATALGSIFSANNPTTEKTVLAEEVAKKPVVEAIFDTVDSTNNKKVAEVKLGGTFAKKDGENIDQVLFSTKVFDAQFAATDTSNPNRKVAEVKLEGTFATKEALNQKADTSSLTDKADKNYVDTELAKKADKSALRDLVLENGPSAQAVAAQLLTAQTKDYLGKAILGVTKEVNGTQQPALETDLSGNKVLQDAVASNGTLKAALASAETIAAVPALQKAVAANTGLQTAVRNALAEDGTFKSAVNAEEIRKVMSQPVFEIPADDNAPISWDWI